eukprot:3608603-Prymnesium_polylepis.1
MLPADRRVRVRRVCVLACACACGAGGGAPCDRQAFGSRGGVGRASREGSAAHVARAGAGVCGLRGGRLIILADVQ